MIQAMMEEQMKLTREIKIVSKKLAGIASVHADKSNEVLLPPPATTTEELSQLLEHESFVRFLAI